LVLNVCHFCREGLYDLLDDGIRHSAGMEESETQEQISSVEKDIYWNVIWPAFQRQYRYTSKGTGSQCILR
jgi:hypothetical protein